MYWTGWNAATNTILDSAFTYTLNANTWIHIGATFTTNLSQFYINGVLQQSGSTTYNWPDATHPIGIGGYHRKLKGRIGTFSIYNKALSATEISQNFEAGRARYGI